MLVRCLKKNFLRFSFFPCSFIHSQNLLSLACHNFYNSLTPAQVWVTLKDTVKTNSISNINAYSSLSTKMYVQTIVKQIIITGSEGAGLCNISLFQRKGISFCHSFYFFLNIVSFDKNTHDPWQKTSQEKKKKNRVSFFYVVWDKYAKCITHIHSVSCVFQRFCLHYRKMYCLWWVFERWLASNHPRWLGLKLWIKVHSEGFSSELWVRLIK